MIYNLCYNLSMIKTIKQLPLISILMITFFISLISYAESNPIFETLAATSITSESVYLHGDFYSENTESFPIIWFQYGVDSDFLNKKTGEVVEVKKDYMNSQFVSNLSPDTKYYFRTVLEINSSIYYGDTLSFVTPSSNGDNENIGSVSYSNGSSNEALDQMLQGYDSSMSKEYQNESIQDSNSSDSVGEGTYSFFDFFKWFRKKKDEDIVAQSNLVHSEEEIKQIEEERERRLGNLSEQERYNNSASEDDEFGEMVKYNTNYNNKTTTKSSNLIYSILIFIIVIILVIFMFVKIAMLKRRKSNNYKDNLLGIRDGLNDGNSRYNIPIKRDLHDPKQNPNLAARQDGGETTFFRRTPKK